VAYTLKYLLLLLQIAESGLKSYFASPWNRADQAMYAVLALVVLLRYTITDETYFDWTRNVYAIDLVMFYLRILQLFLIEKHLGPKIIMIRRMVI